MANNILLLQGSPRADGNSADLATSFLQGAEDAGKNISMPDINGKNISGCLSCEDCRRNGGFCRIHDYMYVLYREFSQTDTIVIATPIYFFALPAQIKAIIDRLYCYGPDYPRRSIALMLTSNDPDPGVFTPMIDYYEHLVKFLGWENKGALMAGGLKTKGEVKLRPIYQEAYQLGYTM